MAAERGVRSVVLIGTCLGCIVLPGHAGEWKITPMATVTETATDNVALSNRRKKADLVTDVNPGLHIEGYGGRSKLFFDYQMHNLFYARASDAKNTQHALNALGTLEALEDWLFIEASGVISQQSTSAFNGVTPTDVNTNINGTSETSTYRLSPYIRGTFGGFADYQLRYDLSTTRSKSDSNFDHDIRELAFKLKGDPILTRFLWQLDITSKYVEFGNGRSNEADRLRAVLTYQLDPQFRFSLIGGSEANDYMNPPKKETYSNKGASLEWAPTERTRVLLGREDRFFGRSNTFSVSHRTALTAWRYRDSRDAAILLAQEPATGGDAAALCQTLSAADCVTKLLANAQLQTGFLTTRVTLQHTREMSFVLLGARNTLTFAAAQIDSENLAQGIGTGVVAGDDFSQAQNIRQRGGSVIWTHRLTPMSSLTGGYTRMKNTGTGGATPLETDQKVLRLNFLTQLSPKSAAGIGLRHVVVDGTANYTENALTAVLKHEF